MAAFVAGNGQSLRRRLGVILAVVTVVAFVAVALAAITEDSVEGHFQTLLQSDNEASAAVSPKSAQDLAYTWCGTYVIPYPKWHDHVPDGNVIAGDPAYVHGKWKRRGYPWHKHKPSKAHLACNGGGAKPAAKYVRGPSGTLNLVQPS